MSERAEREVPFTLQLGLIWLVIAVQLSWQGLPALSTALLDTDDAMRLVQVREFLAGRSWFDLHQPRVAPPEGYDTHWSRLIDAGLAGLYRFFALFGTPDQAELLMRAAWPLLWLAAGLAGVMSVALRLGGENGLFAAGFVAALSLPGFSQFHPGRIDHHNVQIVLTVLAVAGLAWADRKAWAAAAAGLCAALALAVGLESLAFIVIAAGAVVLRYVCDARQARSLALFCGSFALALALVFPGTTAVERLTIPACDALAINIVLPLVPGALLLALVAVLGVCRSAVQRLLAAATVALATAAAILALDPRCIGGPFATVDPAARQQWLSGVQESLPLWLSWSESTFAIIAIPLFTTASFIMTLLLNAEVRRGFLFRMLFALFISATVMGMLNTKVSVYAFWFAIPLLALVATRLWAHLGASRIIWRVAIIAGISPFLYVLLGILLTAATAVPGQSSGIDRLCNHAEDFKLLAQLPPGLVVSDVDTGPFILARTPHSVLAAPYHRLGHQIAQTMRLLSQPPEEARKELTDLGVTYLAICRRGQTQGPGPRQRDWNTTLERTLLGGTPPDWLKPVIGDGGAFLIYRMLPEGSP